MAFVLLLAALQAAKPEKPLDPANPRSVAEHAIYNTRSQEGYEIAFQSTKKLAKGDPFKRWGTCLWKSPGLLALHYQGSGGEDENVLRVGPDVWVYDTREEKEGGWVNALEAFQDGAGRGLENPDEVLEVLSKHVHKAKFAKERLEISFSGQDLAAFFKNPKEIDLENSTAAVLLETDKNHRLKQLVLRAEARLKGGEKGSLDAQVDFSSFNPKAPLKAVNAKGEELRLSGPIQKALDAFAPRK